MFLAIGSHSGMAYANTYSGRCQVQGRSPYDSVPGTRDMQGDSGLKGVSPMLRMWLLMVGLLVLLTTGLPAKPAETLHDLHLRHEEVQLIELVPGVEVPVDMWEDDHVVTVEDLVAVGVTLDDAETMVGQSNDTGAAVNCSWGRIKMCYLNGIPLDVCCPRTKNNG